jgi:FeS assembly SUF system protein
MQPPEAIREQVISALRTVYDPEIPVNIYELGLIYEVDVKAPGEVTIKMTLTSPACPVAGSLPGEVAEKVSEVPGVADVDVKLVWDPPWSQEMMTEEARLQLGLL